MLSVRRITTPLRRAGAVAVLAAAASAAVAVPASAAPAPEPAAASGAAGVVCNYRVTADWLRHRTSPKIAENAPGQYVRGTVVPAERDVVVNGFRRLADGEWAAAAYLVPTDASCGRRGPDRASGI
jgi:hypothetical protein